MLRKGTLATVATALALCSLTGVVTAQEERPPAVRVEVDKNKQSVDVDVKRGNDATVDREDEDSATEGMAHRASQIQGMKVINGDEKEIGAVSDVAIDVRAGQVKYAALSYGGVLGFGDKLFAVPWDAFEHRHDSGVDQHKLMLNIDEATLGKAPGFDQSNWPDFADPTFDEAIQRHFGEFRQQKIIGMTVNNTAGKNLGTVNDLMIDMATGQVRYAAVSYGGLLGVGDKLFAVPWDSFTCDSDESGKDYHLTIVLDEATFRENPGFDQDSWPSFADTRLGGATDEYEEDKDQETDDSTDGPERPIKERSNLKDGANQ
ncbi:MAG: PRC-barrel domain-containing protein [Planctomycetia bacterium]|nr:PRC-barrel domain-containing protein [Planctomycetia bacterium]